jgi:hypothetical protein
VLGIFIATGLVNGTVGLVEARGWTPGQKRKLLTIAGVSVLMLFVNPYGHKLVLYPFDFLFRIKLGVANVQEWASVDFHGLSGKILLGAIFVTVALTFLRKHKWPLESLLLFFLAIYSSVTYVRFLFLAGIIFAPLIARRLDFVPPYEPEKDKPLLNAVLLIAILVFVVVRFPREQALAADVAASYPAKAGEYLASKVRYDHGPVFNDYLWGGYLILYQRDIPVYVDSRVDIYEYNGLIAEYLDTIRMKDSLENLDKRKIRYVLTPPQGGLAYVLRHSPNWKMEYSDNVALVFARVD